MYLFILFILLLVVKGPIGHQVDTSTLTTGARLKIKFTMKVTTHEPNKMEFRIIY